MNEVTHILEAIQQGDPRAADELLPLVYEELRKLAAHRMAQEAAGQTLQPTALVHEAWLRLVGKETQHWENRAHFFSAAAEAMRRILIDSARRKRALRHGGGQARVDINNVEAPAAAKDDEMLLVNEAIDQLALEDQPLAELVKLRFFAGFTNREIGELFGLSEPTIERRWRFARAWLHREIQAR